MKTTTTTSVLLSITASTITTVAGFSVVSPPSSQPKRHTSIRYTTALNGLFDGVKDAFSQPPSSLSSQRETPIDRWMGWSVVSEKNAQEDNAGKKPVDFVDSMDEKNYVGVRLSKPMGIVFEENDSEYGGIFVQSLMEDGIAAKDGTLQATDQLVTVGTKNVSGLDFDDALAAIIESEGDTIDLSLFRGTAKQFYGPTGPSKDWLAAFAEKGGLITSGDAITTAAVEEEA